MKKFASLLLALVMCLCCLTTAALAERAPVAKDDLKIGFIFLHDENSTYDLNFITAAKAACEKLGIAYETKTNIPEGQECYDAAAELADAGCDIIFADSFGHESYMIQAALEFPEVEFCHATGTKAHTENLPNYHNAFATIYEGRYLAGVAAGMKLNEMIEAGDDYGGSGEDWLCRRLPLRGSEVRLHLLLPRRALCLPLRDHGSDLHLLLV